MSTQQLQYLEEMGIDQWELAHPERLGTEQSATAVIIPENCKLLIVSNEPLLANEAQFIGKVSPTLGVTLEQCFTLTPTQAVNAELSALTWAWQVDCDIELPAGVKRLSSSSISLVESDQTHKRALWQQIKSYG
ncbi:DNA polymerase III subunit psi [Vibrio sp. SCSIO 43136]|uniref:DNA polymerase III subunit psi n=1 Tax=Vibrio sp. SCSIO 43136 TaxID=2819101 RepID=UPI0020754768|nr:DNA polymerase III subunit psi [Vibrio sp. SCSIO 43136]USD64763.1 DNA polymerase III subunit psi [Vibrio sp. SCSIO 43136]